MDFQIKMLKILLHYSSITKIIYHKAGKEFRDSKM